MSFKLAEMFVKIGADDLSLSRALSNINQRLEKTHAKMEGITRAATRFIMAGAAAIGGTMFIYAKFEDKMARVRALTGATEEEFARLEKTARKLGMTTEWSASQVAEGMQQLAMAGFTVNEIIAAMPGLLSLATAGQIDLAEASTTVADTLRSLNWEASRAGDVADIMAKTATTSTQSFTMLGEALSYALPLATANNQSFTQLNAAIGLLASRNIKASRAGTSLAGIFARLSGAAQETTRFLTSLGVVTEGADGKMRPFADIIEDINKAMANLGEQEKSARVMQAFGLRAGPAMTKLLEIGGQALRDYDKEIQKAGGSAAEIARIQLTTLTGRLKILLSAFQELTLKIANAVYPVVERLMKGMQRVVDVLNKLSQAQIKSILGFGAAVTAVMGLVLAFSVLLKVAMFLLSPMSVLIGVFGMLAAWLIKVRFESVGLAGAIDWLGDKTEAAIDHMLQWWAKWAGNILSKVAWVKTVIKQFGEVWDWLKLKTVLFVHTSVEDIKWYVKVGLQYIGWFFENFTNFFKNAYNFWKNWASNLADNWTRFWQYLVDKMWGDDEAEFVWKPLTEGYQRVLTELPKIVGRGTTAAERELAAGIAAIEQNLKQHHKEELQDLLDVWGPNAVRKTVEDIQEKLKQALKGPRAPKLQLAQATIVKPDAAFVGIVEMARKIQEAASGGDPLQRINELQLNEQQKMNDALARIDDNIAKGEGGLGVG